MGRVYERGRALDNDLLNIIRDVHHPAQIPTQFSGESGYTARHLHWRIANIPEHKYSAIGKHLLEAHGDKNLINEDQFRFLKKCHGKFNCLVYDMLFNKELRPSDSICVLNCLFSL